MTDAVAARWLARAWRLLIASSALYFLADNEADNDLWVHLFSGNVVLANGGPARLDSFSYTAAGAPWVNHEWLTQALFAAVHAAEGSIGLWLLKLVCALLTAWLLWRMIARRGDSPWTQGGVMLLALAVLARGYAVRPQVVSYLGVAALLAWLDRERPLGARAIAAAALGFALWANAHGGVVVGLGIVGLYAVLPDGSAPLGRRVALLAAVLAAACLTPYGPGLFLYIVDELRVPHPLSEWQPVVLADSGHRPFLLMLALLVVTLPFARTLRRRPWWAALTAIVAVLALRSQRHTPLLALVGAAPLAEQCAGALEWLRTRTTFRLSAAATALLAAALAGLAAVQLTSLAARVWRDRGQIVFAAAEYPVGALRFLRAQRIGGHLALPLDWGGYALWHGAPALKVSLDGRFATLYPPAVVEDNFAFFRADADPAAARLLDAYDTTLVLVPRGIPTPLDGRPGWTLLYTDQVAALFAKQGVPAAGPSQAPTGRLPFP